MMNRFFKFLYNFIITIILISFVGFLAGCSHKSVVMGPNNMRPYKDFSGKTLMQSETETIQIAEVLDFRKNTQAVGVARTGVQYKETPVVLSEKLEGFISNYFKRALLDRRVNIIEVEDSAKYKLTIKINELWLEEKAKKIPETVDCKANFTFELKGENKNFQMNIWNETTSPGDLADGTTKLGPTFSSCLNLVAEKLVKSPKFVNFIKRM